jgi:hypothetical protein
MFWRAENNFPLQQKMKCEELQFNLPFYAEGELDPDETSIIEEHLVKCPVCRVKLSEFQSLQNDIRMMARPVIPADLVYAVRSSVAAELVSTQPRTLISNEWREWLQMRLMPYLVGITVSLSLTFAFLFSIDSLQKSTDKVIETARINSNRAVILTNSSPKASDDDEIVITNEELAALRMPVSSESPSLNTRGALLALANSLMRGKVKNDEVTFVADVFSDGLSQIAEVIEAPRSRKSMEELSKALENDPSFVPADLDRRSNVVRVVFKIQKVDVFDKPPAKKKSPAK